MQSKSIIYYNNWNKANEEESYNNNNCNNKGLLRNKPNNKLLRDRNMSNKSGNFDGIPDLNNIIIHYIKIVKESIINLIYIII